MSKFLNTGEAESLSEIEGLLQVHSQVSASILNKIKTLVSNAEKDNLSIVSVPIQLLKFLLREKSFSEDIMGPAQFSNSQNIFPPPLTSQSSSPCLSTSSPQKRSPEQPRRKGLFSMGKRRDKKENTFRRPTPNTLLDIERNIAWEEKIRKRFSLKSSTVIKSLGLSPQFLLCDELDNMPSIKITSLTVNRALTHLKGPGESSQQIMNYGEYSSATSFSNYPKHFGRPYVEGDPICDRFNITLFENRVIVSLADGCNWGDLPRKAAKRATKNFNQFVANQYKDITSLRSAGSVIVAAFAEADRSIRENLSELGPPPGTTTMIGGILAEVNFSCGNLSPRSAANAAIASNWDGSPWVFIFANVGDCKCYHYSNAHKKLKEISSSTRVDVLNATNPGGRLGGLAPDLDNCTLSYCPCDVGDILLFFTDGMYDNFNPIQQGKMPSDLGLSEPTWESIDSKKLHSVVDQYMVDFIEREMIPSSNPALNDIVSNCANFVKDITSASRNFMEQNPKSKLPPDLKLYPGKLDHSTCAAIKVGKIGISYNDWVGNTDLKSPAHTNNRRDRHLAACDSISQMVGPDPKTFSDSDDWNLSSSSDKLDDDSDLIGSYQAIRKFTKMMD